MHGMTWKQEMHVIFDTTWHLVAAGETSLGGSLAAVTCLFPGKGRNKSRSADFSPVFSGFFFLGLLFSPKDPSKQHSLAVLSSFDPAVNIQRIMTCLLPVQGGEGAK